MTLQSTTGYLILKLKCLYLLIYRMEMKTCAFASLLDEQEATVAEIQAHLLIRG